MNKLNETVPQLESAKSEKSKSESEELKKANQASNDLEKQIYILNKTIESEVSEISTLITQKDESEKSFKADLEKLEQDIKDKNTYI